MNYQELAGLNEGACETPLTDLLNIPEHLTINYEDGFAWTHVPIGTLAQKARAELLRLARENAELHSLVDAKVVKVSIPTESMYAEFENYARLFKERAERAEAELSKAKTVLKEARIIWIEEVSGYPDDGDIVTPFDQFLYTEELSSNREKLSK